jgi:hypothetical protein
MNTKKIGIATLAALMLMTPAYGLDSKQQLCNTDASKFAQDIAAGGFAKLFRGGELSDKTKIVEVWINPVSHELLSVEYESYDPGLLSSTAETEYDKIKKICIRADTSLVDMSVSPVTTAKLFGYIEQVMKSLREHGGAEAPAQKKQSEPDTY